MKKKLSYLEKAVLNRVSLDVLIEYFDWRKSEELGVI